MIRQLTAAAALIFALNAPVGSFPTIKIITQDSAQITSKEEYTPMSFALADSASPKNNIAADTGMAGRIRGRGNNSWRDFRAKKKSYRIKLGAKTPLFGLEPSRDWVLHSQHRDETLLYNAVAFELGRRFGFHFNHSFNFTDLYINGSYMGVYLLTEHNQVGPGRVDIDKKDGWFAEIDEYYDNDPKFRTDAYDLPIMIKSPKGGRLCPGEKNPAHEAIKSDLNALTDALASPDFPESGYREMIDIGTFIDFLIINELAANTDLSHPRSVFLYKDKDGPISLGPLWDFDSGYGWNYRNWMESGFNDHFNHPDKRPPVHAFFKRFYEDPTFAGKYRERWTQMYDTIASIPAFIDSMAKILEEPAQRNFNQWWYKTMPPFTNTRPAQPVVYGDAIEKLKKWYAARVYYLNALLKGDGDIAPDVKTPATANQTPGGPAGALPQDSAATQTETQTEKPAVGKKRGFLGWLLFWR